MRSVANREPRASHRVPRPIEASGRGRRSERESRGDGGCVGVCGRGVAAVIFVRVRQAQPCHPSPVTRRRVSVSGAVHRRPSGPMGSCGAALRKSRPTCPVSSLRGKTGYCPIGKLHCGLQLMNKLWVRPKPGPPKPKLELVSKAYPWPGG